MLKKYYEITLSEKEIYQFGDIEVEVCIKREGKDQSITVVYQMSLEPLLKDTLETVMVTQEMSWFKKFINKLIYQDNG